MENIKIFYDNQAMYLQKFGGISRYYYELVTGVERLGLGKAIVHNIYNKNGYFADYFGKPIYESDNSTVNKFLPYLNRIYEFILTKRVDIVHPTYYGNEILKYRDNSKAKWVVTVHDMIHEKYPEFFSSKDRTIELKKNMIYSADHIIAVSENTKRDILYYYPEISDKNISIIYHGIASLRNGSTYSGSKSIILPERYVLFVGNRDKYKNFKKFAEGIFPLLAGDNDLYVVCIGGKDFKDDEFTLLGKYQHRFIQISASDSLLASVYKNALCFVFPSLYEGFGMPTLEAFSCGCPAIISNTSSMPEVGGEAAVYINPDNPEDITKKINDVIYNEELRQRMIAMGYERLNLFSWDKTVVETVECYKKILNYS